MVINGRRQEVLEKTSFDLDPTGERIAIVVGDISRVEIAKQLVQRAIDRFDRVDILINNAGIFKPTPFLNHTESDV